MYALLTDTLIPVDGADSSAMSLPGILATLSAGQEITFPGLAAHQRQAWFCFLVQLAALALSAAGRTDPPTEEVSWRDLLANLAGDDANTAFSLLVEDVSRPAFLQPPVRSAEAWAKFLDPILELDALDILNSAKNHDVKKERVARAQPHHWLYALLNLQTMQGYFGSGNYGIARMKSGYSSRVFAGRMGGPGWSARFRRDLHMVLARRQDLLDRMEFYREQGGLGLLWLEPWDVDQPIALDRLDPDFIEICRRVRLIAHDSGMCAKRRPNEGARRIEAAAAKGVLGDPWAPIDPEAEAALTIGASGFDYRRVVKIVTNTMGLPASMQSDGDDIREELDLHFVVLVRGEGRTDGLHERIVSIPRFVVDGLYDPDMNRRLEMNRLLKNLSDQMLHDVGKSASPALRMSLLAYLQGGPETNKSNDKKGKSTDERMRPVEQAFDRAIDADFLNWLWRRVAAEAEEAEHAGWQKWLVETAHRHFREGLEQLPAPVERRERARVTAERVFYGMLRKNLPLAFSRDHADEEESAA